MRIARKKATLRKTLLGSPTQAQVFHC
jgi:hypothetical protein